MLKIALINGITMGILNFYHFFTYFGPFFILFDPFLAFGHIWGKITIDCHLHIYKLCKKCTHKWYFYGIFNFYHFFTYFGPFLTLFDPFLAFGYILDQFPIDCHMRIYKLGNHAKNCTHKWYYYGHF